MTPLKRMARRETIQRLEADTEAAYVPPRHYVSPVARRARRAIWIMAAVLFGALLIIWFWLTRR